MWYFITKVSWIFSAWNHLSLTLFLLKKLSSHSHPLPWANPRENKWEIKPKSWKNQVRLPPGFVCPNQGKNCKFSPTSLAVYHGFRGSRNQEKLLSFEGKLKGNTRVQFRVLTEEEISSQNSCGEFRFLVEKIVGVRAQNFSFEALLYVRKRSNHLCLFLGTKTVS